MPKMERNIWKIVFILTFIFSFFGISTDVSQEYRKEFTQGEDVLILGLKAKRQDLNYTVHSVGKKTNNDRYEIPKQANLLPKNLYAVADLVEKEKQKQLAINSNKMLMTNAEISVEESQRENMEVEIPAGVTIKIEPNYRKNQIIGIIQTVPENAPEELQSNSRIMISKDDFKNLDQKTESSEVSLFYDYYSRDGLFVTYVMVDDPGSEFNNKIGIITQMENNNCEVIVDDEVVSIQTEKLILLDYDHEYTSKNAFTTQIVFETRKQILIPKGITIQVEVTDDELEKRIGTIQNGERRIKGTKVYIEPKHRNSLDLKPQSISILEQGDYVLVYSPKKEKYNKKVGRVTETCSANPNHICRVIINGETQSIKRMNLIPITNIVDDHDEWKSVNDMMQEIQSERERKKEEEKPKIETMDQKVFIQKQ